jgi:hypothetical protein
MNDTIEKVAPVAKAIIGALVAFLASLATGLEDGALNWYEFVIALGFLIGGFGAVFSIPNKPPFVPAQEQEPEPTQLPASKATRAKKTSTSE